MKAISYQDEDGIRLVIGIAKPTMDPEASLERARIEVAANGYQARFAELVGRNKGLDHDEIGAVDELKRDVARYAIEFAAAVRDHAARNPVYFQHVNNEVLVDDETADKLEKRLAGLGRGERLTPDGAVIFDNRGRVYYCKNDGVWCEGRIKNLSEVKPEKCIWQEDLSDGQIGEIQRQKEQARIDNLSLMERKAIVEMEIEMAAKHCAEMRSTLEVKGDDNALDKARRQFELLKAEIIERYKLNEGYANARSQNTGHKPDDGNGPTHARKDHKIDDA